MAANNARGARVVIVEASRRCGGEETRVRRCVPARSDRPLISRKINGICCLIRRDCRRKFAGNLSDYCCYVISQSCESRGGERERERERERDFSKLLRK